MQFENDKKKLGETIKKYRLGKSISQEELAEMIDLNQKQISRIEIGKNYPTYKTFINLVNVLDIDIKDLVINAKVEINQKQEELIGIIKNSPKEEIEIYFDVIKALNKNLRK